MLEYQSELPFTFLSFGNVVAMRYVKVQMEPDLYCCFCALSRLCSCVLNTVADKSASPQTAANVFVPVIFCLSLTFSYGITAEGQNELRATPF